MSIDKALAFERARSSASSTRSLTALFAATAALAACGGGGGSDPAPAPPLVQTANCLDPSQQVVGRTWTLDYAETRMSTPVVRATSHSVTTVGAQTTFIGCGHRAPAGWPLSQGLTTSISRLIFEHSFKPLGEP